MRPVPASAGSALRNWTRHTLPSSSSPASQSPRVASITASNAPQRRSAASGAEAPGASSFDSPFGRSKDQHYDTRKIPSFKGYASNSPEISNRVFQYFMAGSMGLLAAAGAKNTVQGTKEKTHLKPSPAQPGSAKSLSIQSDSRDTE
ncbi:hypothetical protein CLCR_06402 [Cladophialophora carrionii]|uniref:Uncharacterized protein n=1 Tax=Cladophialophora carrionii TaxID=86049 RepID=A0A1C1C9W7_9EURO|nr:hypothetical protein CLCR_06402 [Cladophialophora carrionii]